MIALVDQSGQLGGAELCLADLAVHRKSDSRVLLFAEGPFAELLKAKGVETCILPLPQRASQLTKKAGPLALASTVPALARHVLGLRNLFKKADLIYLNTAKALIHGAAANAFSRRPALFHLHDLLEPRHFSATSIRLLVAAANRMNAVIANSQATADAFAVAGGKVPVHVIPNGFDPAIFDAVPAKSAEALRIELNPRNAPVVAIFGRLARWKGQDVLLRAVKNMPDLVVWIVGEALFTADDRAYADELKALAGPNVKFLGFRQDVPELMKAADIIVHSSVSPEPFGRVLVEAMLSRKPLIAAREGGPLEIVEDGVTGILTAPGDSSELESAIKRLASDEDLRRRMGDAGRIRAERLFALPVVLQKTDTVLEALLSGA